MMKLEGRKAIVTGAAQGIGRGIAEELARAGCDVLVGDLLDRPKTALAASETLSGIEALGRRALAVQCDVRLEEDCEALVRTAREQLGGLDILVCNAGVMQIGGVSEITSEQWRRVLDVNLTGTFQCCRAALPHMLEAASGVIVNIASTTGLRTSGERVAYSSSKFGVVGLTQALASEVAPKGVRVNCVCPAFVRSGMSVGELMQQTGIEDPARADAAWTKLGEKTGPLGRSVEPSDIGRAVVWLCESEMVVGIALPVTGGNGLPGLT
ncbi:MAG: SDR family NAD(P)-dependent oxidoreductase [bacterium]|nr:SDR family NAD(P)-dependent oxidoreductase [bacterium]